MPAAAPLCLLLLFACLAHTPAAAGFRVVARSGDDAPGRANERLNTLAEASIDNEGRVAFYASTQDRTTLEGFLFQAFVERETGLRRIQPAGAGHSVSTFGHTSSGLVLFRDNTVVEGTGPVTGLWIDSPAGVTTVVRRDPLPIGGPVDPPLTISDNGLVAYSFRDANEYPHGSVWLFDGTSSRLIANGDDLREPGATIATGSVSAPIVNNAGDVLFEQRGVYGDLNALVLQRNDQQSVIASPGAPAAGVPNAEINALFGKRLNNRGEIAYWSTLRGDGIDPLNNQALYFADEAGTSLIAREGAAAPGVADDARFASFVRVSDAGFVSGSPTFELNDHSQLAFMAWLRGDGVDESNDQGVWRYNDDALELVIREGMPAPGGPAGSVVAELSAPVLNDAGQLAFAGKLSGPGVNAASDDVVWATDPDGVVELIVREGDLFPLGESPFPAENRLQRVGFLGGESLASTHFAPLGANGRATGMNDRGQVAFFAQLANGEQMIVVSDAVAIPEPHAFALLLTVGLLGAARSTRG